VAVSVDHQDTHGGRGARVCLVDADPHERVTGLANCLAQQGYRVTLLGVGSHAAAAETLHGNVTREQLRAPGDLFVQLPHAARRSYLLFLFLRNREFDVIQFPAQGGMAYYALLARTQGLALQDSRIVVRCGGTRTRQVLCDNGAVDDVVMLDEMFLERRCLELADHVACEDERVLNCVQSTTRLPADGISVLASVPVNEVGKGAADAGQPLKVDWQDLYARVLASSVTHEDMAEDEARPLVSICLVHFDRPRLLEHAVSSLYEQDYDNLEVILVDDGSTQKASIDYLASLEPVFAERGWRIIRQENAYLGAARNHAAREARGEYLLFLDDDNIAAPGLVSTLVKVMNRTRVDILTCATSVFEGNGAAPGEIDRGTHWVPLGPAVASGVFRNVFGDATALIRKATFDQLGGYTEDYGIGHEDWEFFARAVLAGCRLETVPVPLLYYRVSGSGMLLGGNREASLARSLRPYLEQVPKELRPVLLLALGQEHSRQAGGGAGLTPAALLKLMRGFAGGGGKSDMIRRFVRVGRSQGWGVAIRAALRYSSQDG
jgi:GT2 family glycosyltransferase